MFIYRGELACFTVGVGVPSFFMEYEGRFGSQNPKKCWDFTVRERGEIYSCDKTSTINKAGVEKCAHEKCVIFLNKSQHCHREVVLCNCNNKKNQKSGKWLEEKRNQHTSLYGRVCVCTVLSRPLLHRVHFLGPQFLHHHPSHFYSPLPQRTAVPLDTVHNHTTQQNTTNHNKVSFFFWRIKPNPTKIVHPVWKTTGGTPAIIRSGH